MLDARVYRAAFLPLLLALFVVAFSLERRPPPATTVLAADAFNGELAFSSLSVLGAAYPSRLPGSAGDDELGRRVGDSLRATGFQVTRRDARGRPAGGPEDSTTVVGVRPGVSSRRIVVVADRTARHAPGLAELSGTAALLELARIFRSSEGVRPGPADTGDGRSVGRDLRRTLVLVSSSGASLGDGGPAAKAIEATGDEASVDAVVVLGDLAGGRVAKPWIVPWSDDGAATPIGLRRTFETAVRTEVGAPPGGARASGQWARRAFPLTVSAQGDLAARGLPAVLLGVSGERGPGPRTEVTADRLGAFGRAALRTISAVDEIGAPGPGATRRAPADGGPAAFAGETRGIVTMRRVLPDWAVRLLVGTAALPALLAALDGFFRMRRRRVPMRRWLGWAAAPAIPVLAAYAWLRVLALVGAIGAPASPVTPGAVPVGPGEIAALVSVALLAGLVWVVVRRTLTLRLSRGEDASGGGGAAAAIGLLLCATTAVVWLANPYAAMVLVPAAHLWLLASAPGTHLRGAAGVLALALGLLAPALVVLHYASALDLGPGGTAWLLVLVTAGGHVSVAAVLAAAVLAACLTGAARAQLRHRRAPREAAAGDAPPSIRGRGLPGYAGPGSLGGTESALRR
jgi:hypothetical protein